MAYLAVVMCHSVNGVARMLSFSVTVNVVQASIYFLEIHTEILTSNMFAHFYAIFPEKFNNKTNGVTVRRWINQANRPLGSLLTESLV
jgi:starch phosphorylase